MKKYYLSWALIFACVGFLNGPAAMAGDLILNKLSSADYYESTGNVIAQTKCVIAAGRDVTFVAVLNVVLKAGFRVMPGAKFAARIGDHDGLSNACELKYFGHLDYGPGDDPDKDGLTNGEECELNLKPNIQDFDNDDDMLPDRWEIDYFGDLANGRNQDTDGDGVTNYMEYKLNANPASRDLPGSGLHYEYDALGRITRIYRIPKQ